MTPEAGHCLGTLDSVLPSLIPSFLILPSSSRASRTEIKLTRTQAEPRQARPSHLYEYLSWLTMEVLIVRSGFNLLVMLDWIAVST